MGEPTLSRVLVTGALGFIGGELTRSLIEDGREITVLVRDGRQQQAMSVYADISEVVTLQEMIEHPKDRIFDTIYHLATFYTYDNGTEDIPLLIESNIVLPTTLADIAARWKTEVCFVNISTFMQHFEDSDYMPTCLYAATKQSAEDILSFYSNNYENFSVANIVFPHIYGESDLRTKLLNVLINASRNGTSLNLGSGKQLLDLVHVSDAIVALKLAENLGRGRWSIGSDKYYSIREITEIISELSRIPLNVDFDAGKDRQYDTFRIWQTAERLPGWSSQIDLKSWLTTQLDNSQTTT
jgi:nucleoside-diphosphate-sugar epimerase